MRLLILLPLIVAGQTDVQSSVSQPAPVPTAAAGESVALGQLATRMTVPVSIAGASPRPFVIDTGAERSVVSQQLATELGLAAGPAVRLTTMTGNSRVPTVVVPSLTAGPVRDDRAFDAPALDAAHLGADGLLGVAQLRNHMVMIDFARNEMSVRPSRKGARANAQLAAPDEVVIVARSRMGQLIVTQAEFEGQAVTVILDTGSQISMGNMALKRKLRRTVLRGPIPLTSVTGEVLKVDYHIAQRVKIGGVVVHQVPVAFADIPPFAHFGLEDRPALMLGMDALRAFARVEIDFPARRVRFLMNRKETGG